MNEIKEAIQVHVSKDFNEEPYGRYPEHGEFNGERFRETFLLPALKKSKRVVVDLSGTYGYGPSFLEEAFGGLVRFGYFTAGQLIDKLEIEGNSPFDVQRAWKYINDAIYEHDIDKVDRMKQFYAGLRD